MTDDLRVKTYGISQVIPSNSPGHERALRLIRSVLEKYTQGYAPGVFIPEIIEPYDPELFPLY